MLRLAVLVVAVLVEVGLTDRAMAGDLLNIEASGNQNLASIDMNDNGVPDETGDCNISARADGDGSDLVIHGTQVTGDKARPCQGDGDCNGSGFVSPGGFAQALIDDCDYAGGPFVPLVADFCSSLSSCLSTSPSSLTGQTAGGPAPILSAGAIFRVSQSFRAGFGQLCSAGGPAAEITGEDGLKVLRNFFPYPNAQNPTHMCVDNVPVQVEHLDDFVMKTACVPVSNGVSALAFEGEEPFALIPFDGFLLPCGQARAVPTANEWGLIGLIAVLLGLGVWALGRGRGFAAGLPLP